MGRSWVEALVRTLVEMNGRTDLNRRIWVSFYLWTFQLTVANNMIGLPKVTNSADSVAVYLPVVDGVVAALAPET